MNPQTTTGNFITFYLDRYDEKGRHSVQIEKSKVINVITDPLGRHETKFMVSVNNESFGIPVSKVIELGPVI